MPASRLGAALTEWLPHEPVWPKGVSGFCVLTNFCNFKNQSKTYKQPLLAAA